MSEKKVAIITGASRGIGRATALLLAQRGFAVVLAARSGAELDALAGEIHALSGAAIAAPTDVAMEDQVNAMVARARHAFGRVDILVNNAAIGHWCPVEEYSAERWDELMGVNLKGAFLCSKAVIQPMKERGGHIVNVSSGAGKRGHGNLAAYSASKFGLIGFSESLALEVAPYRIKVSVILPGDVQTDFNRDFPEDVRLRAAGARLEPSDVAEGIFAAIRQSSGACISELAIRPVGEKAHG